MTTTTRSDDAAVPPASTTASSDAAVPTTKKSPPPPFKVEKDWTLISQGAEARLWKIPSYMYTPAAVGTTATLQNTTTTTPVTAVAKERFSKAYRHVVLDERLTKHRCRAEARILAKCAANTKTDNKLSVPHVYAVQAPVLILQFIEGPTVRDWLQEALHSETSVSSSSSSSSSSVTAVLRMAGKIGATVGTLHSIGVVHGDLTTSNMMVELSTSSDNNNNDNNRGVTMIDFGLAKNTESAEERAVDLYVLERALISTHPTLPETFLETVMVAYEKAASGAVGGGSNAAKCQATLTRLEQVRQRGRKRECFG